MALAKSGMTENSAESFIIDAGVVFKNVKFDNVTGEFTGDPLGATSGGVEISIEKKYRKIDVDGAYIMDVVGLNQVESAQATFKANLIEMTSDNITLAMNGKQSVNSDYGNNIVIEDRYIIQQSDYIPNMAIVGTLSGTGKDIIVIFDNVLITSAFDLKMEDQKEAQIELTGQANGDYNQLANRTSPYRIIYPSDTATDSSTGSSGAVTDSGAATGGTAADSASTVVTGS